jgi:C1A family cysteine protease/Leucine-rich repeat (LRR) protein
VIQIGGSFSEGNTMTESRRHRRFLFTTVILIALHGLSYGADLGPGTVSPIESPVTHERPFAPVDVEPSTAPKAGGIGIAASQLPASFDLRTLGYVTPVRNQGAAGACWAFAAYGSLESTVLMVGGAAIDLSENHLKNYHAYDGAPTDGGNEYMAAAYLSRWDGPVSEADDPYHDYNDLPSPGGPPQLYVREVLMLDAPEEIKLALMTYGALAGGVDMTHYDSVSNTCYSAGPGTPNHGITTIGWDDNKVVPNAPGPGAWLVKNSWGDNGCYFWISYDDTCSGKDGFCFCDAVPPDTYQKVYYHDYYGNVGSLAYSYACNPFVATSNQELVAVQFWTKADGAGYEIRIYDSFSNGQLTGLLGSATGSCAFAGEHTVDLPQAVHLVQSNDFYIYLHITDGGQFPMAADWQGPGTSLCTSAPGESYFSTDGVTWTDLTTVKPTANFCIKGLATTTTPPQITVLGNGVAIKDGDMASSPTDGTFFGSVTQGDPPVRRTFTVRNDGTGTLELGEVAVPAGFMLTDLPAALLPPGASDSFTVRLNTDAAATRNGAIIIANDDPEEHPFNFAISAIVLASRITVGGNNWLIVNGDTTPWPTDGTDFGTIGRGRSPISRTFEVRNDGTAPLVLGSVTVPTGFAVTEALDASIAPASRDTFTVQLDTAVVGTKTGEISFATNDPYANPFHFAVVGQVTDQPVVTVLGNGVRIADGDADPNTEDGTNFGSVALGSDPVSHTFTVCSDGAQVLTLGPVSVPSGFTLTKGLPSSLSPGQSDTFTIRLNTTAVGIKAGDVSFSTNDTSKNPFHFRITGRVAGQEEPVAFPDSNLKRAVEDTLGIRNPTPTDMLALTDLWGWGMGIQSYEGLQYAKNATTLHLGGGPCADVSPLAGLMNLTHLWLDHSPVSDLSALSGLKNLTFLDIGTTNIRDLSQVAGLTSLTELHIAFPLEGYEITDISALSALKNLIWLDLAANHIADISALATMNHLSHLDLWANGQITDVRVLAGMRDLTWLAIGGNPIADISPLVALNRLTHLDLWGTNVCDVSPLAGLTELTTLHINSSRVTDISPLSGLTKFQELLMGNNHVKDITPLAHMVDLTKLDMEGVDATGLSPLSSMTKLTWLNLQFSQVADISALAGATHMSWLNLNRSRVSDISVLSGLKDLTWLGVGDNPIHDVSPVTGLTKLTVLDLHSIWAWPATSDISFLAEFKDLTELYLGHNTISDISALGQLEKLQYLDLTDNQVRDISALANLTTLGTLILRQNPLNAEAHSTYIPLIRAHNRGVTIEYDLSWPTITVLYNGVSIRNADSTPSTIEGTDFGTATMGSEPVSHTFVVRNDGTAMLTFGMYSPSTLVPTGFTWKGGPYRNLAPGESDTLTLQLETGVPGTKAGDFSFKTNDPNGNPFHIRITGTVVGSKIAVLYNGVPVNNGDSTPSTADGTDFGAVLRGARPVIHTFTIRNDGTAMLVFNMYGGSTLVPTGFAWTGAPRNIGPGESDTLTIQLNTDTSGVKTGDFSFVTSDPNNNPFHFRIAGTVVDPDPRVVAVVSGNGITITNGDDTPSPADGTNFGSVAIGGAPIRRTFTIRNAGTAPLMFGFPTVPKFFSCEVTDPSRYTLAPGESNTFTVQLNTTVGGAMAGNVVMRTTDSTKDPFQFEVSGTVTGGTPRITVLYDDVVVNNGSTVPNIADGTDFGTVMRGSSVSHVFTVRNDGTAVLICNSMSLPAGFTWKGGPRNLAPGESDTLTIQLDTSVPGVKTGDFSFMTNDPNRNPFHFRITATVVGGDPHIAILYDGTVLSNGSTLPSAVDGTDFGTVMRGSSPVVHNFTVRNDGVSILAFNMYSDSTLVPDGFTWTGGPRDLGPGESDVLTIRLDTALAGVKTGDFSFQTNDPNKNPFHFRITGTVVGGDPEITVLGNGISISNGDTTPSMTDGTDFGTAPMDSDPIRRTFTIRNDGTSMLTLDIFSPSTLLPMGYTITAAPRSVAPGESDALTIQLETSTTGVKTGDFSFRNNDPDENPFHFRITGTILP